MTITTVDGIVAAMAGSSTRIKMPVTKATIASQTAGTQTSMWRSTGTPMGQGAIPSTAATCNNTTLGGANYTVSSSGLSTYMARLALLSSIAGAVEIHDRLAHMGGLSGTTTTAQTVGVDLNALASTDNISARITKSDYSNVQWFLEWYTATGSTAVTATVSYTNQSGTSGKTVAVTLSATRPASLLLQIVPNAGDYIRSIESVTLSATTGTAGSFGVTATVERASIALPVINQLFTADWASLGLPQIIDYSCLTVIYDNTTTSTGAIGGSMTLIQG